MIIKTALDCGQTAWVIIGGASHRIEAMTVGQIRVEVVDSPGLNDGRIEPGCNIQWDNYRPMKSYKEIYMMVETGIGYGLGYTLGENVFLTRKDAENALCNMQKLETEDAKRSELVRMRVHHRRNQRYRREE